jgi:hypothetical protein
LIYLRENPDPNYNAVESFRAVFCSSIYSDYQPFKIVSKQTKAFVSIKKNGVVASLSVTYYD